MNPIPAPATVDQGLIVGDFEGSRFREETNLGRCIIRSSVRILRPDQGTPIHESAVDLQYPPATISPRTQLGPKQT